MFTVWVTVTVMRGNSTDIPTDSPMENPQTFQRTKKKIAGLHIIVKPCYTVACSL
ncbi:MAG: hypothetical protein ACI4GZ_04800 [Ruminococcus sp.]